MLLIAGVLVAATGRAQTAINPVVTSPEAESVLKGLYDPAQYAATTAISDHWQVLCELEQRISPDTLEALLVRLQDFHNRNSYSDTVSNSTGIGAARRWAHGLFERYGDENEDRLLACYLQFDVDDPDSFACGTSAGWRNVLAILPGNDTTNKSLVLVEAHLDSRCADNCSGDCMAHGMEDNGSGSALVLELARVLSRYTFDRTIVFMLTTGEEQGLLGAEAMALWCEANGIAIKGVQNNDIVGGILCGHTSSPPSCPTEGEVDSLQVRLFSHGAIQAPHRGFARTIKTWYLEKMQGLVAVPMTIGILNQEDRTGRGGDHIPFRVKGYRNVRFTSANESGDANVEDSLYVDRQHTSDDVLGVDTDGDLVIDSFFVDFNYLARNTVINGMGTALLALGPEPPAFTVHDEPAGLRVSVVPAPELVEWRIGVRNTSTAVDFDAIYRTGDTSFVVPNLNAGSTYYISVAGLDGAHIMSPFSREFAKNSDAATPAGTPDLLPYTIDCASIGMAEPGASRSFVLRAEPSPFLGNTRLRASVSGQKAHVRASVVVTDVHGRRLAELPLALNAGTGEVVYAHRGGTGVHLCTLMMDGTPAASTRIIALEGE